MGTEFLVDFELAELRTEVARHHRDFARISEIGDQWFAGELDAEAAMRQIRNIVG